MTKISVVNTMGRGEALSLIYLEGKLSKRVLKEKVMEAVGLPFELLAGLCDIEVKDSNGNQTNKITGNCTIFVVASSEISSDGPFNDLLGNLFK